MKALSGINLLPSALHLKVLLFQESIGMKTENDYKQQMYNIIGAAMSLYNELGSGFSEPIYQECLSVICSEKSIPWEREKDLQMYFHGQKLNKTY